MICVHCVKLAESSRVLLIIIEQKSRSIEVSATLAVEKPSLRNRGGLSLDIVKKTPVKNAGSKANIRNSLMYTTSMRI